jgi:predicted AAA+ superfamily ATPase
MDMLLTLKILLGEFYQKISSLEGLVRREAIFPEAPNKIKVAIGIRRSGKTYFLYQTILDLFKKGIDRSTVLYLNFEDDRLFPLHQHKLADLVEAFYSLYPENHQKKCYLFLDEIQNVENWPLVIRRLHDSKNVEIFLTGSSAKLLSKEIATNLRGRSLSTEIWPYSFKEFTRACGYTLDFPLFDKQAQDYLMQAFREYLACGGFPEVIKLAPDVRRKILQEYVEVAIYKDVIERHNVQNPLLVKYMILFMIHNAGKLFSINKLYHDVKSQGYQTSRNSLYEYAEYIEEAFLAFSISIHDLSLRKAQTNPKKLYAIDTGVIRATTLDEEKDLGRAFENIIYLELRRQECQVHYYLTKERHEVDFLAKSLSGKRKLFQVSWDISDIKTREREERALKTAMQELKLEGKVITIKSYLENGLEL